MDDLVPGGEDTEDGFQAQFRALRDNAGGDVLVVLGRAGGGDFGVIVDVNVRGQAVRDEPDLLKVSVAIQSFLHNIK
jgi:hypothetical protein